MDKYKYSLEDLLHQKIALKMGEDKEKFYQFSGVKIPMIQRDYAQGRTEQKEVRSRFLKAIFEELERCAAEENKDENSLELDFVYGSIKREDEKDYFVPLDGQQRLTTLFLLYWYIGNRELEGADLQELREYLKKFSYATRVSARDFCEKIAGISISYQTNPQSEIEDAVWFFEAYQKDPTVKGMLVMLNAIHKKYGAEKLNLFPHLSQLKFYILPLDGFDLTDDLYIKMNARGKQLTHFENFKADLIKWMKSKVFFQKEVETDGRKMPYYLSVATKIDNKWTQVFWKNKQKTDSVIDPHFLHFWNRFLLNEFIVTSNSKQDEVDKKPIYQEFTKVDDKNNFIYRNFATHEKILNENTLQKIQKILDSLATNFSSIKSTIIPAWKEKDWNFFGKGISLRQRVLHFAVTEYLARHEYDEVKFKNWIRVVWNLIVDSNLRSSAAMVSKMRLINKLSKHAGDICAYLLKAEIGKDSQLYEEQVKVILINSYSDWESELIKAEAHPLLKGNIKLLLPDLKNTELSTFLDFRKVFFQLFPNDYDTLPAPNKYLWLRAVLAKSSEIALPVRLRNDNFNHWGDLVNGKLLEGMQGVIRYCLASSLEVQDALREIVDDYSIENNPLWLWHLVSWENEEGKCLLDFSERGNVQRYYFHGDLSNEIYLYNKTRWTDGNIILSNYRNEIISELLDFSESVEYDWDWWNIDNAFFRGREIELERPVGNLNFLYYFGRDTIEIGILKTDESSELIKNLADLPNEADEEWAFSKVYDYTHVKAKSDILPLLQKIEREVFDDENADSLLSKIQIEDKV